MLLRAALALNKRVATTVRKLCSSTLTGQAVRVLPAWRRAGGVQRYWVDVYFGTVGAPGGSLGKCWNQDRCWSSGAAALDSSVTGKRVRQAPCSSLSSNSIHAAGQRLWIHITALYQRDCICIAPFPGLAAPPTVLSSIARRQPVHSSSGFHRHCRLSRRAAAASLPKPHLNRPSICVRQAGATR